MKVLITGSKGFVGNNLIKTLQYDKSVEVFEYSRANSLSDLSRYTKECDFVIHLAGVNRTDNRQDFYDVNSDLTKTLISSLEANNNFVPILLTSSIHSDADNDYGMSKKAGEELVIEYSKANNTPVYIYKLPNLFGKWSKPFYNSVVATWSYQIANSEEISISDESVQIQLLYIDDLIAEIISKLNYQSDHTEYYYEISPTYLISLKKLAETLKSFKANRKSLYIADMSNDLERKLYSTYLSYLPNDDFKYELVTHSDSRGSFTELLKSISFGQVSVNIAKGFEIKGNHWHHSKNEKFIVVKGQAKIKFRNVLDDQVIEYLVSDEKFEVVDIPTGYVHTIENLLAEDLITIMWVNEPYDENKSDTYVEKVEILWEKY